MLPTVNITEVKMTVMSKPTISTAPIARTSMLPDSLSARNVRAMRPLHAIFSLFNISMSPC